MGHHLHMEMWPDWPHQQPTGPQSKSAFVEVLDNYAAFLENEICCLYHNL